MTPLVFKTTPFAHQLAAIEKSFHRPYFAYLMEQGTGKSKTLIDRVGNLFLMGLIDRVLIIAPNGVHANWIDEQLAEHLMDGIIPLAAIYRSGAGKTLQRKIDDVVKAETNKASLPVLSMNIEAFVTAKAEQTAKEFLKNASIGAFIIMDESSNIKNPGAHRSKVMFRLAPLAKYRAILTGTEVTQGPLDFYSQFQFLHPGLLGCKNFMTFKNHYAEWRERIVGPAGKQHKFNELVRYKNLDELKRRVAENSFQVLKKDCLDLPDQIYEVRPVVMGSEQQAIYNQVKKRVLSEFEFGTLTIQHALTKSTRLLQIAGGFLPLDHEDDCRMLPNAKLSALDSLLDEIPASAQVIIWARFIPELRAIVELLGEQNCAKYWGEIDKNARRDMADEFKAGKRRFMVAQQRAGGKGHTWIAGTYVIYFSNSYSYEDRKQSEDRAHRIGQTEKVTYIDLVAEGTIDEQVLKALRAKKDVADFFKGQESQWLK